MNFTVSTKPLIDSLSLGVVNANVSKYFQKSCLAQITADRHDLRINIEAHDVATEMVLKGSGDTDETVTTFVDCLILKQLVATFEAAVTTLEFTEGGVILHSGRSKFTLPKMVDGGDLTLTRPADDTAVSGVKMSINKEDWSFVKNNQMYAIAMSFIHPVYTYVWIGEGGDVLVGDFDNSIFTHSGKSKLGSKCLLRDTIINLFNSLPDGASIYNLGESYLISVGTDSYAYRTEFRPVHEDNDGVGNYNADIILSMMSHPDSYIKIDCSIVNKFLSQSEIISSGSEETTTVSFSGTTLKIEDNNTDCDVAVDVVGTPNEFSGSFNKGRLRQVLTNLDTDKINIGPSFMDDAFNALVVWTPNMTTVVACAEQV